MAIASSISALSAIGFIMLLGGYFIHFVFVVRLRKKFAQQFGDTSLRDENASDPA